MRVVTDSARQTIALGKEIARHLKPGDVIALIGELGTGKTTFTKGIAQGLAVKDSKHLNSPSFVLIKEYKGKIPLYHFDFYRVDKFSVRDAVWYEEYFFGPGVSIIEWAEKIKDILPKNYLEIIFLFKNKGKREIRLKSYGAAYKELLERL